MYLLIKIQISSYTIPAYFVISKVIIMFLMLEFDYIDMIVLKYQKIDIVLKFISYFLIDLIDIV